MPSPTIWFWVYCEPAEVGSQSGVCQKFVRSLSGVCQELVWNRSGVGQEWLGVKMLLNYFFQWSPQMTFYNEPLRFGKLIRTPDRLLTDSWRTPDGHLTNSWQTHDGILTDSWRIPDRPLTDSWRTPDGHLTDSWLTPDQLQEINFKVSIWRAVPIEL